jgi:glucose-6-phosphate isomerase
MKTLLTRLPSWKALCAHHKKLKSLHLRDLFAADPDRGRRFSLKASGLYFDYSKHRITDETLHHLFSLARECRLGEKIKSMFNGEKINITENRPALHVALRTPKGRQVFADGTDVVPEVHRVLRKMADFSELLRRGKWKGLTGKRIRNIVNIGIGGSDLGPVMAYEALRYYSRCNMNFRFISNVDAADFAEATFDLDQEETLFIVSSKSFTTTETMLNATAARKWILKKFKDRKAIARHFVAVSTNEPAVAKFGIDPANMFEFWDWVGGRYSMDSAIGLSTMIAVGQKNFLRLLSGFHSVDEHFRTAPFEKNMPVIMGLLTVWYNNFFGAQTTAVLPYSRYLVRFPAYLQQLTMESNGKYVTIDGDRVNYETGPVFWGEAGTNSQHSFYQLIHQGTKIIPCDFIGFCSSLHPYATHHDMLTANLFAQSEALAFGRPFKEVIDEGIPEWLARHRVFEGNRPSSTILADRLTPETLGKLVALYEHSVFTQGIIWHINSFDQWGVELGKALAKRIGDELGVNSGRRLTHDSSTNELIRIYRKRR